MTVEDYSADYNVDGVVDAVLTNPTGSESASGVKVRRGALSIGDLQSGFASPGDVPFIVWLSTIGSVALEEGSTLTVGSVVYSILSRPMQRPDGAQARVYTRIQE